MFGCRIPAMKSQMSCFLGEHTAKYEHSNILCAARYCGFLI